MGAIAIVLGLFNLISDRSGLETPSAAVQMLTYVLLAMGLFGFIGSLIIYMRQKSSSQ